MKVLISPAKTIDIKAQDSSIEFSEANYLKESKQLINKLQKLSAKKIESLMHISPELAQLNHTRFQNWEEPNKLTDKVSSAIFAFNGEVYKGFNAQTLSIEQLSKAQETVRILSGLYGILKPLDLIYPYRLEMGTKWDITPKQKNLYQFWGNKLAYYLNGEMQEGEVLIDLASTEYSKAIDKKIIKAKIITPVFKEFKNGEFKIVMMYAKHARGAMARYIVVNNIEDSEQLKLYNVDGYMFDINQSTENSWVFIR
jgi:cytoplasmic iron level regulating protein YaaA (DUF328/UPF0246 family)